MKIRGLQIRAVVPVSVFIIVISCLGYAAYSEFQRQSRINRVCEENLKVISYSLKMFTVQVPGEYFPPLSRTAGRLMFEADSIFPAFLTDTSVMVSLAHPNASDLIASSKTNPKSLIDDHSYWYLGFRLPNERTMESFVEDYKIAIKAGKPIPEVDEIWPEYIDEVERFLESHRREWDETEHYIETSGEGNTRKIIAYQEPSIDESRRHLRIVLGSQALASLFTQMGSTGLEYSEEQARIPVLIERPELHGDGGHVLFMDGHVEFVPYPGKFPMTEDYIAGLRALDTLGESDAAN
jgi:prepilin-type processing-associated H-X9-DG protein